MTNETTSRRDFIAVAACAGTATALTISSDTALAYQGNMERALGQLQAALQSLHEATSDKGGHKAKAAGLIQDAMREVQAGIDFAAAHGD